MLPLLPSYDSNLSPSSSKKGGPHCASRAKAVSDSTRCHFPKRSGFANSSSSQALHRPHSTRVLAMAPRSRLLPVALRCFATIEGESWNDLMKAKHLGYSVWGEISDEEMIRRIEPLLVEARDILLRKWKHIVAL